MPLFEPLAEPKLPVDATMPKLITRVKSQTFIDKLGKKLHTPEMSGVELV